MVSDKSVSIIVPIYNVKNHIEKCVRSLFEQTYQNIEYIFVDDCSPDNSISILKKTLEEYPHRKEQTQIIRHKTNKGLPSARNSGLKYATGKYVFHCDSDDYLEKNAINLLLNEVEKNNADIVWCDWYLSFKKNERYISQKPNKDEILSGKDAIKLILSGKIRHNVWNKLVKRELYFENNISFPDGYGMGEDITMIKLFSFTDKVCYLPKALYHYNQTNENAFTQTTTETHLEELKHNINDINVFLQRKYNRDINDYICFFKLNAKLNFLISNDKKSYEKWLDLFPEANEYIDKNHMFSTRIKILQKMALNRNFWFLKLHYYLVTRIVYGFIYN